MPQYGKPKPPVSQTSTQEIPSGGPPPADPNDGWKNVHAGAPEKWAPESIGDALIGTYVGFEDITIVDAKTGQDKSIRYFDIRDDLGHIWSVPDSYQIGKAFGRLLSDGSEAVPVGSYVRLTFTGEVNLNKPGHNPMKNYQLDVRRDG